MNLKDAYNTIARDWVADHSDDTWWQTGTNLFLDLLPPHTKILDVGCGAGVKTKYISTKGYQVEGIDLAENMIEIAKERNPDVEFSVFDIYEIDTFPKKFDGIFAQAVLLHIEKKRVVEVLKKFESILNDDGLASSMSVNGRKLALEKFSYDRFCQGWKAVLDEVVQK